MDLQCEKLIENLRKFREFYQAFKKIQQTLSVESRISGTPALKLLKLPKINIHEIGQTLSAQSHFS